MRDIYQSGPDWIVSNRGVHLLYNDSQFIEFLKNLSEQSLDNHNQEDALVALRGYEMI